jgi:hypothetical protein
MKAVSQFTETLILGPWSALASPFPLRQKGYKISRMRFCNQLQDEIMRDIIIQCGGNPDKLNDGFDI